VRSASASTCCSSTRSLQHPDAAHSDAALTISALATPPAAKCSRERAVLVAAGIKKLCKGRKRAASVHLRGHFAEGKRDAKQIDINQRGIDLKDIKGL
jgi:hypothetical protein